MVAAQAPQHKLINVCVCEKGGGGAESFGESFWLLGGLYGKISAVELSRSLAQKLFMVEDPEVSRGQNHLIIGRRL